MPRMTHVAHRHLVRAERAFGRFAVDDLRAGPALRRAQDDHGPAGTLLEPVRAGVALDALDLGDHRVERGGHELVHLHRVVALDEIRRVTVAAEERFQFVMRNARQHGGAGDLVAVQVQDGQHGAVVDRIEELVRVPTGGERAGLRFAIADDARDEQVGIVERRPEGVRQRIAQLAALVNRARRLRRDVARNAAGEGELLEQPLHPVLVLRDVGIDLAVGAFQVGVRHQPRPAVARPGDVDDVQVVLLDDAVQVDVDEVQPRRRAPVAEQARLDVRQRERLLQQRIVVEINLPDRQIVRGAPIGVHLAEQFGCQWLICYLNFVCFHDCVPFQLD